MPSSGGARGAVSALGLAAALVAAFLGLELTARLHLFGPAGLDPRRVDSVCHTFESGILVASEDPELGFELGRNLDVWFQLKRLRTNARGLRYRELEPAKPEGVFRAAVMGSSFTLPAGVELEDAFHARLERRFSRERAPTRYEFVNFAVPGYHPAQSMTLLERRGLAYEPDLIVFSLTRLGAHAATSPRPPSPQAFGPACHAFLDCFLWRVVKLKTGWFPNPRPDFAAPPLAPEDAVPTPLERLEKLASERGIPVVVVRLEFVEPEESENDRRLRREARDRGFHYVDTRSAFAGLDTRSMWIFDFDPHPDATAHGIFADVIGAYLLEAGLLDVARVGG